MSRPAEIAGLILAAGGGERFGPEPKLLADYRGRPLVEHAIAAQCAVPGLERIVVVLGARADELLATVDFGRAEPVVCERWSDGQAASLRCGLEALSGSGKVLVTLGDEPLITPTVIARMAAEPPGARAVYEGVPGHPVVLGPEQFDAIGQLTGDRGARALLGDGPLIECGELGSARDVDTHSDLEELRNEAGARV
jgi:CTP:molybdopterin cytidylyltransferase MocA